MDNRNFLFLKQLTECFGPSGTEDAVRDLIVDRIKSYVTSLKIDSLGNLIAKKGDGGSLVISAHMDEVAFTVTGFESDGTLRFSQVGGITPSSLPSKRVYFPERDIFGVIGAKPIHMNKERGASVTYGDLYIDIGAFSETEAKRYIQKGDLAIFDTKTEMLHSDNPAICGKAIDDRLGCYLLCELICDPSVENCTFVFSVQEEVGLLGASGFAANHSYDYGIALDVTTPNDLPNVQGPSKVCELGKGPVISFADGRCIYDAALISDVFKLLQKEGIPCQTKALRAGGNEASSFQNEGGGMNAISVSTPCRYIHGPIGVVWERDIENTKKAILLMIKAIQNGGFENV